MLYQIAYIANGIEGKSGVQAASEEEALAKFRQEWTRYGDALPSSFWVAERWSQN